MTRVDKKQNQTQSFVKDIGIEYTQSSTQIVSGVVFDFFKSTQAKIFNIDWKRPVCNLYAYLRDSLVSFAERIIASFKKKDSEAPAAQPKQEDLITPQIPVSDQTEKTSVLSNELTEEEEKREAKALDLFIPLNSFEKTNKKTNSHKNNLTTHVDSVEIDNKKIVYKTITRNKEIEDFKTDLNVPPIPSSKSKMPATPEADNPPPSPVFKEPLSMPFIVGNPKPSSPKAEAPSTPTSLPSPKSPFSLAAASMQLKMGFPLGVRPTSAISNFNLQTPANQTEMEEVD